MSGIKCSDYSLDSDRLALQQAVNRISLSGNRLKGVCKHLTRLLDQLPESARHNGGDLVQRARQWLAELSQLSAPDDVGDLGNLEAHISEMESLSRSGSALVDELTGLKDREERRQREAAALLNRLRTLTLELDGAEPLLASWCGDTLEAWRRRLTGLPGAIENSDFSTARNALEDVETAFRRLWPQVQAREARHRQRLYVAEALQKVCCEELGFKEIQPPRQEDPQNPASALICRFDTYNNGIVTFRLTLEDIQADSCIRENLCLNEFDALSRQLQERFGVKTRFRPPADGDRPRLIRRDARDLPRTAAPQTGKSHG